jgi:long-chain acyl-CoA synthetase
MNAEKNLTITQRFRRTVRSYPGNIACHYFDDGWKTLTYEKFSLGVDAVSSYLKREGLKEGARAAILLENRPEWCSAYLSILMAGGVAVPLDSQLGPDEIRNLLDNSGAEFLFYSGRTAEQAKASFEKLSNAAGRKIVSVNVDSRDYQVIVHGGEAGEQFHVRDFDDLASLIYTSGTTGKPKGVRLTHRNFCSDADALIEAGIVTHEDNVLSILPLHHTYAFMCTFLVPVFLGASITYPESLKGPDMTAAMRERKVSILIAVPQVLGIIRNGMMNKIRELPLPASRVLLSLHRISGFLRRKLGINIGRIIFKPAHSALGTKFRFFASGGARLDPSVMKDLEAFGFTVLEGYGLTETSPVVTFNPFPKRKPGSAGKPLPSVQVRIVDPSESGEGEIAVRGPMVMEGYYRNPEATEEVLKEGWFYTGDIGKIDEEGYLFITGRKKEVIVLGSGKNIYPEEVEKTYLNSPFIKEICVLGIEGEEGSETLHAVIVPDLDHARKEQVSDIRERLKWEIKEASGGLPSYMRITGFSLRTEPLPRTRLGKLRRFMIRKELSEKEEKIPEREKQGEPQFTDEISGSVARALSHIIGQDRTFNLDDNLELDLGLDSLSRIELVAALEKIFSLSLPEDFMADIQTVRDLIGKVRERSGEGSSSGETAGRMKWKELLSREPSEQDLRKVSLDPPEKKMPFTFLLYTFLKILFKLFFRLEAKGIGNLPLDRKFIIAPNHTSYLDGFAVILSLPFPFFKNIYSLGLSDYFTGPVKSRLAKTAHVIPIDSSSYLNKALQMSAFVLNQGRSLSVFPEGGRSFDGELMEFKKGVGILAIEMEVPVVPVFIKGAYEALPRAAVLPRFEKITVTFDKPLYAKEIDISDIRNGRDKYQQFADILRERVKSLSP